MTIPDQLAVIRRWVYCRCTYARQPTDPCRCTEADIRRAERESRAATARWEDRLRLRYAGVVAVADSHEELRRFAIALADRIHAAHEVLARLAERRAVTITERDSCPLG